MTQSPASPPARDDEPRSDALGKHLAGLPRRTLGFALWLLPVVALANVAVLVWSLGRIDLAERLVAPHLLALAGVLVFVPMIANSLRLAIWSRFLGLGIGFSGALRVITGAMIANSVTPSAAGGMPIKVLFLIGEGIEPRRAIALISFQTAEDGLTMFTLAVLATTLSGFALADFLASEPGFAVGLDQALRIGVVIAGALVLALALLGGLIGAGLLGERVRGTATGLLKRLRKSAAIVISDWRAIIRRGKTVAALNLAIAAIQWSVRFSIAGLVLGAFGAGWHPALYWLLQYLVQTISSTVPSPGGVGGAEAGFLLLFSPFVDPAVLLPAMSTWRLLFFYVPLTAAAVTFYILRRQLSGRAGQKPDDSPAVDAGMPAE